MNAYTERWPAMAKKSAEQTIAKYGLPNEALPSRLIWSGLTHLKGYDIDCQ